jgi:hypothetical protein
MGEYPALSDQEIAAILDQKIVVKSTPMLGNVTINVEHLGLSI